MPRAGPLFALKCLPRGSIGIRTASSRASGGQGKKSQSSITPSASLSSLFPYGPMETATREQISLLLDKPVWDISTLFHAEVPAKERKTMDDLEHLVRLSAMQQYRHRDKKRVVLESLNSHLGFVKAVQAVDTAGIEPLVAIRDETESAEKETEITLDSLKHVLENENQGGRYRRITQKAPTVDASAPASKTGDPNDFGWDPIKQAKRKIGRYIQVNLKTD